MIELRVLGTLVIQSLDGGPPVAAVTQPKLVALLLYLALAEPPGPQSRDSLAALLWPEADDESTRHSLRNTLYGLRQALGEGAIVSRGEGYVGLDPAAFRCDAVEVRALLAAQRWKEALAAWVADARREAPRPGPLGRALGRSGRPSGSPTEQVVDLVWGAAPKEESLPEVPDVSSAPPAPLPPATAIPPAAADHGTVQMWALEPKPKGKRGNTPLGQHDTLAMPPLECPAASEALDPTIKMEQLLRDPSNFETVEIERLEQITAASETVKVPPLVRGPVEPTQKIGSWRRRAGGWRERWAEIQLMVAAVLLLLSPLGREQPARADDSPAPAAAALADRPAGTALVSAAPVPPIRCHLAVTSRPRHALVRIDDKVIGETPLSADVDCAGGVLAVEKERYKTAVRTLSFAGTSEASIDLALAKRSRDRHH